MCRSFSLLPESTKILSWLVDRLAAPDPVFAVWDFQCTHPYFSRLNRCFSVHPFAAAVVAPCTQLMKLLGTDCDSCSATDVLPTLRQAGCRYRSAGNVFWSHCQPCTGTAIAVPSRNPVLPICDLPWINLNLRLRHVWDSQSVVAGGALAGYDVFELPTLSSAMFYYRHLWCRYHGGFKAT